MKKLRACVLKEWKLLWRDKLGLLVLFVLPMCLVMFISFAEFRQLSGDTIFKIIILSEKSDLLKAFREDEHLHITESFSSEDDAKAAVKKGKYQALLVIPKSPTDKSELYLDPSLAPSLGETLSLSLRYIFERVSYQGLRQEILRKSGLSRPRIPEEMFPLESHSTEQANSVQQNVPAWSLFAMFYIIIPLAGTMVLERKSGIYQRLLIAPVARLIMLLGKVIPYCVINMIQLVLMLVVGVYILPLFGLPTLELFPYLEKVLCVGIAASGAAIGFGILIGTWVHTYQQTAVVAPLLIIILAAIGGIFVPPYLMPKGLIAAGQYISPFSWGQSAFLEIFVRHADWKNLLPNITKLLVFFLLTISLSLVPRRTIS